MALPLKMSAEGRVQCNYCDADRGVKTYTCPFRFCEQVALCPSCALAHPEHRTKVGHRAKGCESRAAATRATQTARRQLSNSGHHLLTATARACDEIYHAIFRAGDSKVGKFIPSAVYDRCTRAENPTLEDCQRWAGRELPDAPSEFDGEDFAKLLAQAALVEFTAPVPAHEPSYSGSQSLQSTLF